jgi:integrase
VVKSNAVARPNKPRHDFPLTPRGDNRWCKRVRGKLEYFRGTAQEAIEEWLRVKDALIAGRPRPPKDDNRLTIAGLVNTFLTFKKGLVASGEIGERSWNEYDETSGVLVDFFGRERVVEDIAPLEWQKLRESMAKRWGPTRLGNQIGRVKSICKYGFESDLLDRPVKFGPTFVRPSEKVMRQVKIAAGPRDLTADQINALIDAAGVNMKVLLLLGINTGMGTNDFGNLPLPALDLENGWLNYARPKTAIWRRAPLWAETIEAIKASLDKRHEPKDKDDANLAFISPRRCSYARSPRGIILEFERLCKAAGVEGHTIYDLRRTFETVADNLSHDKDTCRAIMGHAFPDDDMTNRYRQGFYDERLIAVTDCVHRWLFSKSKAKRPRKKVNRKVQPQPDSSPALRVVG